MRRRIWLLCVISCCVIVGSTAGANALPALVPANPAPADQGSFNPDEQSRLTWEVEYAGLITSSNSNMVRYDVFLGKTGQMRLFAQNLSEPWFEPGELEAETEYQWQVITRTWDNQVVIGPVWTFCCIQWIRATVNADNIWFRCLKPGRYAALASKIKVASNNRVGLNFGPRIRDLGAPRDTIPTWYTFGEDLEQALSLRGWIRAADLSGRSYPGLFPKSCCGTEVEFWVMIEPSRFNGVRPFQTKLRMTLTKSNSK